LEGLRKRAALPLIAVPGAVLCFVALVLFEARMAVWLFYWGAAAWVLYSIVSRALRRGLAVCLVLALLAAGSFLFADRAYLQTALAMVQFGGEPAPAVEGVTAVDYGALFRDGPVSGVGLGNIAAIAPQYSEPGSAPGALAPPRNGWQALLLQGGALAVMALLICIFAYLRRSRGFQEGVSGRLRAGALMAVGIFLLYCLVANQEARGGSLYLALLFAVLALPSGVSRRQYLPSLLWRGMGLVLVGFGLLWLAAGWLKQPWHSSYVVAAAERRLAADLEALDTVSARRQADRWIQRRPLDWRAYAERAKIALREGGTGAAAGAKEDFARARFVAPLSPEVPFREGQAWLGKDPAAVRDAWELSLQRAGARGRTFFRRMLSATERAGIELQSLDPISRIDLGYRMEFLRFLEGEAFIAELRGELARSPSLERFSPAQRSLIVANWIDQGSLTEVEAFLRDNREDLDDAWWLEARLLQMRAFFEDAVALVRERVRAPEMPSLDFEAVVPSRVAREFAVDPDDWRTGTLLFMTHVQDRDYDDALSVIDALIDRGAVPAYAHYWRAECLYQTGDFIESWFSFATYLRKAGIIGEGL
jgi:hypothetical protein